MIQKPWSRRETIEKGVHTKPTYTLSKVLDLRVLERKLLQIVLDTTRFTRPNFDVLDLHSFILKSSQHALLFAWKKK